MALEPGAHRGGCRRRGSRRRGRSGGRRRLHRTGRARGCGPSTRPDLRTSPVTTSHESLSRAREGERRASRLAERARWRRRERARRPGHGRTRSARRTPRPPVALDPELLDRPPPPAPPRGADAPAPPLFGHEHVLQLYLPLAHARYAEPADELLALRPADQQARRRGDAHGLVVSGKPREERPAQRHRPRALEDRRDPSLLLPSTPVHDAPPSRPAPPAGEGPDRRALPRAAGRSRARARRAPLDRALQPRVPQGVRRDAAPVPAHPPARARRGAAANTDRTVSEICFTVGLRIVGSFTSSFGRAVRMLTARLPRRVPTGLGAGADPDVHAHRVRPAESSSFGEDSAAEP